MPSRGTEFSDAETGRQNPPERPYCPAETRNPKNSSQDPRRNGLFRSTTVFAVRQWWRLSGPNCMLPTQTSNRSPIPEPGTEFFAAETADRIGLLRLSCAIRDRTRGENWQTCL